MSGTRTSGKRLAPVKESRETRALRRFFPEGRGRLTGEIEPGFFEPGSPRVREEGRVSGRWIMGGLFCIFTWDEHTYVGTRRDIRIRGYSIVGWDTQAKEYRMLRAANLGVLHQLRGNLRGNTLPFVSDETMLRGKRSRVRYTFIRKKTGLVDWIAEISAEGGPWQLISKDVLKYS